MLPEPFESFELYILISPIPLFAITLCKHFYNKNRVTIIDRLASHVLAHTYARLFVLFVLFILVIYFRLNPITQAVTAMVLVCNLVGIFVTNSMYWAFRILLCIWHFNFIRFVITASLQMLINFYYQYANWIFSIQIWIPLIFVFISYLRDVSNEYRRVFKHCLESVLSLIKSNRCIEIKNMENVAILSGRRTNCRSNWENGNNEICSKVMIFYHNGVPHVKSTFFYEIRDLLEQVLGSSLSIKIIILKELESIFFRLFPIIFTMLVISKSNFSSDEFEPVQTVLVGSVLFHSYSKLFLHRKSQNIDISANPYLRTKLHSLIRQHKDEFNITPSSEQSVKLPVPLPGICCITYSIFELLLYLKFYPIPVQLLQLRHLYCSTVTIFLDVVYFTIFLLYLVLLLTVYNV